MGKFEHRYTTITQSDGREFTPYIVMENGERIHLVISQWRKVLFAVLFKVWPFVLIALTIPVFYFMADDLPVYMGCAVLCAVYVPVILLFRSKPVYEVMISRDSAEVNGFSVFKRYSTQLALQDANDIYLRLVYGRGGGAIFSFRMKDGAKVDFLSVPYLNMQQTNVKAIAVRLKELTGLEVAGSFD